MVDNKTIHFIPPLLQMRESGSVIYCRVSINSVDRLENLVTQIPDVLCPE